LGHLHFIEYHHPNTFFFNKKHLVNVDQAFYCSTISPQTIRSPASPAGCDLLSSSSAWITSAVPSSSNNECSCSFSSVTISAINSSFTVPSSLTSILGRSPACGPPSLSNPCSASPGL